MENGGPLDVCKMRCKFPQTSHMTRQARPFHENVRPLRLRIIIIIIIIAIAIIIIIIITLSLSIYIYIHIYIYIGTPEQARSGETSRTPPRTLQKQVNMNT